ncbi:MAG: tRNA pseudouridine(55) synthase TruB [Lachnospiraceae bacterium]|nr:tRNA pseudouridine(55) synthase TruB [Lachnospiraceae bacterium]
MYHGILNVYKEKGYTSFDVVAKLRGICGQKKIGHTGTLDPDAEGLLPVCLGRATKVCDLLTDRDKAYRAVMLLGVETDTQDMSGKILSECPTDKITEAEVRSTVREFVGEIEQVPPMYSALKVNGQKLCDLARKGKTVERRPRKVTVYSIDIEKIDLPRVTMSVRCSKGTYIRTLCHDIGEKLGCHAAVENLLRTEAAGYMLENAHRLDEIQSMKDAGMLENLIRPLEDVFQDWPALQTKWMEDRLLYNGNPISPRMLVWMSDDRSEETRSAGLSKLRFRVFDSEGVFCAIYRYSDEDNCFVPVKMFLPDDSDGEDYNNRLS